MSKWFQELKDSPAKFAEKILEPSKIMLMPCQKALLEDLSNFKSVGLKPDYRKTSPIGKSYLRYIYELAEHHRRLAILLRYLPRRPNMKRRGGKRRARKKAKQDRLRELLLPIKWEPKDLVIREEVGDTIDGYRSMLEMAKINSAPFVVPILGEA